MGKALMSADIPASIVLDVLVADGDARPGVQFRQVHNVVLKGQITACIPAALERPLHER
jgi:hypothetical protein